MASLLRAYPHIAFWGLGGGGSSLQNIYPYQGAREPFQDFHIPSSHSDVIRILKV